MHFSFVKATRNKPQYWATWSTTSLPQRSTRLVSFTLARTSLRVGDINPQVIWDMLGSNAVMAIDEDLIKYGWEEDVW